MTTVKSRMTRQAVRMWIAVRVAVVAISVGVIGAVIGLPVDGILFFATTTAASVALVAIALAAILEAQRKDEG